MIVQRVTPNTSYVCVNFTATFNIELMTDSVTITFADVT